MTSPPPRRALGTSGMSFSTVGLGTSWEEGLDEASLIATVRHAVEGGVNWIDTAAFYGLGRSERQVARALAALPEAERPFVVTKCGLRWREPGDARAPIELMRLEPASIREEIEDSLRRLERERLDLYLAHWPPRDPPTPLEEYWQTLVDLRAEGKVRAVGLSNHDAEQLERAEAIGHVDAIEPPFSAIHRSAAAELAWCADHGAGAIVYSPMASGLLTGAYSAARVAALPPGHWRREDVDYTTRLGANLALADALAPIAERHGVPRPAVAIAWTLAWPGVTGAIAGARTPAQVDDWIAGAALRLAEDDLDEIAAAIERSGAGEGPARPPRSS
jgi:aryl-alcohol dehydrogenase-like predicted oxidoreductase